MKKLPLEIVITVLVFVVLCIIALTTNTTGDNGDSILHHLYSHGAFKYPSFFLHHWAKPLFVLLSAPFAQPGFKGIEIFNCACASLMALLSFYTARQLKLNNAWLVFVFILFAPFCFKLIFSGLTEYLFALVLIGGVYCMSANKPVHAATLISFLPMVRSEGLLIIGVFAIWLLWNRQFKALLFLALGQLLYSVVGAFYYKDLLWVFNKIPYANMGSPYGHGKLSDMAFRLNYVIEKPIYVLLLIGLAVVAFRAIRDRYAHSSNKTELLIAALFVVFFVAHSLFWWRGIFNSMGLPRVFISVVPLVALLALEGLQSITEKINNTGFRKGIIAAVTLIVCLYPFSYRPQGVVYNKDLFVVPGNSFISEQLVPYIQHEFPDYHQRRLYYNAPYMSLVMKVNHFDPNQHKDLHHILYDGKIPSTALAIWDEWFSVAESGISLAAMKQNPNFELIRTFEDSGNGTHYAVFKVKNN